MAPLGSPLQEFRDKALRQFTKDITDLFFLFIENDEDLMHDYLRVIGREGNLDVTNMTLGKLIEWLSKQDPNLIVADGFGKPHSDRGDYSELAFDPAPQATLGEMLRHAKSALERTFTGWKGGEFTMHEWTPVLIGEHGDCGEAITEIHFKYWLLTAR